MSGIAITLIIVCLCAFGAYLNLAANFQTRKKIDSSPGTGGGETPPPTKTGSVFDIKIDRGQGESKSR